MQEQDKYVILDGKCYSIAFSCVCQFFINIYKLIINDIPIYIAFPYMFPLGVDNETSIFATIRLFSRFRERDRRSKAAAIINSPLCPKCRRL